MALCTVLLLVAFVASAELHTPVVINTDMNVDDMAAIAYLLRHHNNILAITVSAGGFSSQWAGVDNALRLVHHYNRSDIPVAFQEGYFGQTQLNLKHPSGLPPKEWQEGSNEYFTKWVRLEASPRPPAWQSAAQLIVEVLKKSKEKVHFLELGPYTNLAAAMHRDGSIVTRIERLYAEGGRLDTGATVQGLRGNRAFPWTTENKPQTASWNVYLDPIAAAQVYGYGFPLVLLADNACDTLVVDPSDPEKFLSCRDSEILDDIILSWGPSHGSAWSSLKYWDQATSVLMFDLLSGKPTSCERWVLENFTVSLQNDATYATFVPGRFGAATEACVASNREQFLRSFYAC